MATEPRFCPFCREPFEGDECPDHGLRLVPFTDLATRRGVPSERTPLPTYDLRFGRGAVLASAVAILVGFAMPAIVDHSREGATTSGFALFQLRADYLGVVPAAAVVSAILVFVRRTRFDLARARLAIVAMAAFALLALVVAARHVRAYASEVASMGGVSAGIGAYVVLGGLFALVVAASRLGRARPTR